MTRSRATTVPARSTGRFRCSSSTHDGDTLLQRRHASKRLWPGYWSNGCCSHPRHGEVLEEAVIRRAHQELGLTVVPEFLFKFQYRASFGDVGSEFELCSVFVSHGAGAPRVNTAEIAEWRWIPRDQLDREMETAPDRFHAMAEDRMAAPYHRVPRPHSTDLMLRRHRRADAPMSHRVIGYEVVVACGATRVNGSRHQ